MQTGTGSAQRFSFGDDLGRPAVERRAEHRRASDQERLTLEAAEREAYARGVAVGRREAEEETDRRRLLALEGLAAGLPSCLAGLDRQAATIETEALSFFGALARKLADRALAEQPLAEIKAAASEAFRHLRGVPHLVARVNEALVEAVDLTLRVMARESGFEGRIIVIGSDEIPPGDARLEWADGAVAADRRALEQAVAAVLDDVPPNSLASQAPGAPTGTPT